MSFPAYQQIQKNWITSMTDRCIVVSINWSIYARSFTSVHLYQTRLLRRRKADNQGTFIRRLKSISISIQDQVKSNNTWHWWYVCFNTSCVILFYNSDKAYHLDCSFLQMPPREKTSNLSYRCNVNESKTKFHHSPSCAAAGVKPATRKKVSKFKNYFLIFRKFIIL